jgi:soluble lytic murein transglycosylase-like protein
MTHGWLAVACLLLAAPARADLVYFASGRVMSVRAVTEVGDELVLTLRSGGEIVCARALILGVGPDEVPYPEPEIDPPAGRMPADAAVPGVRESRRNLVRNPAFGHLIDHSARQYGVDPRLVQAVVQVESNYQPRARSRKGAKGLMQLMPATARRYGVRNAFDPSANIDAGVRHLRGLLDRLPLDLALAAYNAGEAAVTRFRGIPPFPETRLYVARVLKLFNPPPDNQ